MRIFYVCLFVMCAVNAAHADAAFRAIPLTNNTEAIAKFVNLVKEKATEVGKPGVQVGLLGHHYVVVPFVKSAGQVVTVGFDEDGEMDGAYFLPYVGCVCEEK